MKALGQRVPNRGAHANESTAESKEKQIDSNKTRRQNSLIPANTTNTRGPMRGTSSDGSNQKMIFDSPNSIADCEPNISHTSSHLSSSPGNASRPTPLRSLFQVNPCNNPAKTPQTRGNGSPRKGNRGKGGEESVRRLPTARTCPGRPARRCCRESSRPPSHSGSGPAA